MSTESRYLAFLAYLLSLPGALLVLFLRRSDAYTRYHAAQSLMIALVALLAPLVWAIIAWSLAWIPTVGAMLGVSLFALVIAALVGLAVSWITGMVYALQGRLKPVPLVGGLAERLFNRQSRLNHLVTPAVYAVNDPESPERRATLDA